jgi:hypothetical protein
MDAFLDPALKNREYRADLVPRLPGWCRPEVVVKLARGLPIEPEAAKRDHRLDAAQLRALHELSDEESLTFNHACRAAAHLARSGTTEDLYKLRVLIRFEHDHGVLAAVASGLHELEDSLQDNTHVAWEFRAAARENSLAWDHIGWAVLAIEAKAESAQQNLREHRLPTISSSE